MSTVSYHRCNSSEYCRVLSLPCRYPVKLVSWRHHSLIYTYTITNLKVILRIFHEIENIFWSYRCDALSWNHKTPLPIDFPGNCNCNCIPHTNMGSSAIECHVLVRVLEHFHSCVQSPWQESAYKCLVKCRIKRTTHKIQRRKTKPLKALMPGSMQLVLSISFWKPIWQYLTWDIW